MNQEIEQVYRNSGDEVRASFGKDHQAAEAYYRDLMEFVRAVIPPSTSTKLLDVGCGSGWSTWMFSQIGYLATGIDLNPSRFEADQSPQCVLTFGSGTEIPFDDESFDVVSCYQCLEHIPSPEKALDEMIRVCRKGGVVSIVGPNLVSPVTGLIYMSKPKSWKELKWKRTAGMPHHPYGDTYAEILFYSILRSSQLMKKLISRGPFFSMREPDLTPPFEADNDACYLMNPTDLIKYFKTKGLSVVRRGKPGRPGWTYMLAGGTWVAAKK